MGRCEGNQEVPFPPSCSKHDDTVRHALLGTLRCLPNPPTTLKRDKKNGPSLSPVRWHITPSACLSEVPLCGERNTICQETALGVRAVSLWCCLVELCRKLTLGLTVCQPRAQKQKPELLKQKQLRRRAEVVRRL